EAQHRVAAIDHRRGSRSLPATQGCAHCGEVRGTLARRSAHSAVVRRPARLSPGGFRRAGEVGRVAFARSRRDRAASRCLAARGGSPRRVRRLAQSRSATGVRDTGCLVARRGERSMSRRRVLLVSYHFPPVGGAGVQRPAKFVRYLPEFGWDVTVLQAANPSVPLLDHSLLDDLPPETVTIKARTLEPGYAAKAAAGAGTSAGGKPGLGARVKRLIRSGASLALQPDPQILWYPAARRAGLKVLREKRHDAIIATAPSYSNLLLGSTLHRRSGLPLLADYRDEWDLSSAYLENAPRDPISWRVQGVMQRRVLRDAAAV